MEFKVALAQINSVCGDVDGNLKRMCSLIERAAGLEAEMIVFPEMCLCGYMVMDGKDFETFYRCVQRLDGESIRKLSSLASKTGLHIVFGAPTEPSKQRGVVYNSAILLEPDGKVNVYNKVHLPTGKYGRGVFFEHLYCRPGEEMKVCDTRLGRIGLQVCRDFAFPEASRIYGYCDVDIIINISAAPVTSKRLFDMVLPVRAFENAAYLVYVNVAGEQRGVSFFGHSRVIDPLGRVTVECKVGEEDFKVGIINLEAMRKMRMKVPIKKDILPIETYQHLLDKLRCKLRNEAEGESGKVPARTSS